MNIPALAPLCALLALAGCAAMQPAVPVTATQLLNDDPTAICLAGVNKDPRLVILEPKIGSLKSAGQAPMAMLASKEMATPDDKKALEIWGNERQRCLEAGTAYRTGNLPAAVVSTFEIGQRDLVVLTARLYGGEITYGQFNLQRQELAAAHRQKYVEFEQLLAAGQRGNSGVSSPYSFGAPGLSRMPVQTSCHRYADISWNCTAQ